MRRPFVRTERLISARRVGRAGALLVFEAASRIAVWQMNGAQVTANSQVGIAAAGAVFASLKDINERPQVGYLFREQHDPCSNRLGNGRRLGCTEPADRPD